MQKEENQTVSKPGTEVHILGLHNLIFLVMIVAAVILSGTLPGMAAFQDASGAVKGIPVFGDVKLTYPALIEVVIILLAAFLSFKTTDAEIRRKNHFTWGAIREVAVLFIGIFITMQPALMILKAKGAELGITEPFQMFWATGFLSSFLDNTPTIWYSLRQQVLWDLQRECRPFLELYRWQCWSNFLRCRIYGANTYIGNAPNFMVKAISDENGIKMPSFFGYLMWSIAFLVPVFLLDMLVILL